MNIYLAGSIFYIGDKFRNDYFEHCLQKAFPTANIYNPLNNTAINGVEGKKKFAGSKEIEMADNERLDNTDILVACIDGDVLPAGTCTEIGVFREKIRRGDNKYIVGITTDNRSMYKTFSEAKVNGGKASLGEQQWNYTNLYTVGCIKSGGVLVDNIDDAIAFIKTKEQEFREGE